jgi:predicted nucleic acid-binding protein
MVVRSFIDSNILIYTDDADAPDKQEIALELIDTLRAADRAVLSTQILQEYFAAATRKLGVPADLARQKVEIFSRFQLVEIQLGSILAAIDLHRLHQVSFWDALVLQAARDSNCPTLYTEDLQHGQVIAGVEIRNPFHAGES